MLEVFLVQYLSKRIRRTVEPKGYKTSTWQTYAVLLWFGVEFSTFFIAIALFEASTVSGIIFGYLFAIIASVILQIKAKSLPDLNKEKEEWINQLGNPTSI